MISIECLVCHGDRYVLVVNAEFPDDPPQREQCGYCTEGRVRLTGSETVTMQIGAGVVPHGMSDDEQEAIQKDRERLGIVESFVRPPAVSGGASYE